MSDDSRFGRAARSRLKSGGLLGALALAGSVALIGCGELPSDGETSLGATTTTTTPVVVASDDILGFEKTPGWTWTSTGQRLSERRTKGLQSFALDAPAYETHLTSQKVSSTAVGLANLADADSQFALDIMLPEVFKTPTATSYVQLKVKSSSRGLAQTDLGKIKLNDLPGGVFKTVKWNIPSSVRSKLGSASYTDLIFDLYIRPFDCPSDTIRVDNLRVRAPSRAPAGAGVSIDLVAQRTYGPEVSLPGEARFPAGTLQIPQSFHVKLGKSGASTNTVKLELGYNTTIAYTCTYVAGNVGGTGKSYDFSKCTGGGKAGDIISADFARLTIVKGDATAGTTKIRAQLAGAPLGDETGRGLIAAMPTWWGETPAEIDQIINAYSTALNAPARTERRFIEMPTPDFALRHGDGSPRDLLDPNLPPIPNDPPFSQEGHMNPGSGTWDAWWALNGKLEISSADNRQTSHFDATASVNVMVWGFTQQIAALQLVADTNGGRITSTGVEQPSSHGEVHLYLLGTEIPPGGASLDAQTGFLYTQSKDDVYNAPAFHIWIFAIQAGVTSHAGFTASGYLSADGFRINVTPDFKLGMHLFGGIDVFIASGGLDANVQLLDVALPVNANLTWSVNTSPGDCKARLDFLLDAKLTLKTLGGNVDLVAHFGVCPFCYDERWRLFSWKGVDLGTVPIFSFTPAQAGIQTEWPLPDVSACHQDLHVLIKGETSADTNWAGQTVRFGGIAGRPKGPSTGGGPLTGPNLDLDLEDPVPCQYWTWKSSNPNDEINFGAPTGVCNPLIRWADGELGQRTLTLKVTNQFGETGTHAVVVNVTTPPPGPLPVIIGPYPGEIFLEGSETTLIGNCTNWQGGTQTFTWAQVRDGVETTIPNPNGSIVVGYTVRKGDTLIKLTCTEGGLSNSVSLPIFGNTRPK